MAVSVDELEKLSEQGRLGPVKVGQAGWPEWPLAMQLCHEVIQKVGGAEPIIELQQKCRWPESKRKGLCG